MAGAGAFKLLYSLSVLQVYNGDADAVSMLDELEFCYSKFSGGKESKTDEASDASDALVEILLSFASKQSQLFRRMSEQVFSAFADKVTENGLDSLVSVCTCLSACYFVANIARSWKRKKTSRANKKCSSRMKTRMKARTKTST